MPLSDYEKEVLAQMEAQLSDQDSKLFDRMRCESRISGAGSRPRRVALGVVLVLVGVTVLVGGLVVTPFLRGLALMGTVAGVVGFVVIVLGVLQIFGVFSHPQAKSSSCPRPVRAQSRVGFMERQQEKWDRRRHPGI